MKSQIACVSILTAILFTPYVAAQKITAEQDPVLLNDISPDMEAAQERRREGERAEDMAILSQILHEDLLRLYVQDPHAALTTGRAGGDPNTSYDELSQWFLGGRIAGEVVGRPLADHLPGYGVVIQIQAPAPQSPAAQPQQQHDADPLSRWEATRRRMRGETVYDGATCTACHQADSRAAVNQLWRSFFDGREDPHHGLGVAGAARRLQTREQIIEALTSVLAEAGGRLRHIQPDERITLTVQYVCDSHQPNDETFLRRTYLDLIGELPTPEEVKSFLADASPEKRTRIIDELSKRNADEHKNHRAQERPDRVETPSEKPGEAPPADPNAVRSAIDDLILHRLHQQGLAVNSEPPLPGRISVTATRRQIDALAAGALERSEFSKQTVVRIFDPAGADLSLDRSR
jgi:hypothetical protein